MHKKLPIYLTLLIALTGCEDLFNQQSTPDWALVDKMKVQQAVAETFKKANPYPAELSDNYEELRRNQQLVHTQIAGLQRAAKQRCLNTHVQKIDAKSKADTPAMGEAGGMPAMGLAISSYGTQNNPELQLCLQGINDDQLIADLNQKVEAFGNLEQKRREHDSDIYKKTNKAIDDAIKQFAQEQKFKLVISSESSIAYNQKQVVLDITSGVIDTLLTPPAATQPQK